MPTASLGRRNASSPKHAPVRATEAALPMRAGAGSRMNSATRRSASGVPASGHSPAMPCARVVVHKMEHEPKTALVRTPSRALERTPEALRQGN